MLKRHRKREMRQKKLDIPGRLGTGRMSCESDSKLLQVKAYCYLSAHFQLLNHFVFLLNLSCIELSFRLC